MKQEKIKKIFVGRKNKLREFEESLKPGLKKQIINIHSYGDGGIGKTTLMKKMMDMCSKMSNVIYTKNFIDFQHTETHNRFGIMRRISENLNTGEFDNFNKVLDDHNITKKPEDRKDYEATIETMFLKDYARLVEQCKSEKKNIVLFFDNYEKVQWENRNIAEWFEDLITQHLAKSELTLIVIVGRDKVTLEDSLIKEMPLDRFTYDEMVSYLEKCYDKEELENKIGTSIFLKWLHHLVEGRPILISLVVDWLEHGNNFNLKNLLEKIGIEINQLSDANDLDITNIQRENFKKALIEHIEQLITPQDRIITYMAFAWRRMTPQMFSSLTGVPYEDRISKADFDDLNKRYPQTAKDLAAYTKDIQDSDSFRFNDLSKLRSVLENLEPKLARELFNRISYGCQTIFLEKLKPLSFIKYIDDPQRSFVLHDEMRDLIDEYWWKNQINEVQDKKQIAQSLVEYYSDQLYENDLTTTRWSNFYAERLYYALWTGIDKALDKYFFSDFESFLQSFHINTCGLLLNEVDRFIEEESDDDVKKYKPRREIDILREKISAKNRGKIEYCRIRWLNERYRAQKVLSVCDKIDRNPELKTAMQQNYELHAKIRHEHGIAHLWLNHFRSAIEDFTESERTFRKSGDHFMAAWSQNWKGYTLHRNGNFKTAENEWMKALAKFMKIDREDTFIKAATVCSNLNLALRVQGRFYESAKYGQVAVAIAKELNNDRQKIRYLNALGDTYLHSNRQFQSMQQYDEAVKILETLPAPDPMLKARVLMGSSALLYGHQDYTFIMEYYIRGNDFNNALEIFRERLPQARERYESAGSNLAQALQILEQSHDMSKSLETSMAYYYSAEHSAIDSKWDEALEYYVKSEDVAVEISSEYRTLAAILGQIFMHYTKGDKLNFEKGVRNIEKRLEHSDFWNFRGFLEIIRGNFEYGLFLIRNDERSLRNAIERYVIASDHKLKFGRISHDRFFTTIQILVKRMADLPLDNLPSAGVLESYKDIWNYEQSDLAVCTNYLELYDDIIDFTIMRKKCCTDSEKRESYVRQLQMRISRCISEGKREFRHTPVFAMMMLQIQLDSGAPEEQAEAHSELANAFAMNDIMFEAHKHYESALHIIGDNENLQNTLLHAKILIRYGTIVYRRGEYAINIEHYRKEFVKENVEYFKTQYKDYIDNALGFFKTAESILQDLAYDKPGRIAHEKADLYFRWAELEVITGQDPGHIENRFKEAIEQAKHGENVWRHIDAIESLISHYYFSEQWDKKIAEIKELEKEINHLNDKKRYSPLLMALLEITKGDVVYEKILGKPDDEDYIEEAFDRYIRATHLNAQYSIKGFFQTIGTMIERIAELPKESVQILHKIVYPRLIGKKPTGSVVEDMYKLVEQFIVLRYKISGIRK